MKKLYNILFSIMISISLLCSCDKIKEQQNTNQNTNYGVSITSVKYIGIDTLNIFQLDSIIKSDTLPEFNNWSKTYIKDGENNFPYQYSVLYNRENGFIYTVKQLEDSVYVLQRKETKKK